MYKEGFHPVALGLWIGVCLALSGCRADPVEPVLPGILQTERETALVADIIGSDGGTLRVTSGPYAGTALDVPSGALSGDAVFSISVTDAVPEGLGYGAAGEMAQLYSTAVQFLLPLGIVFPVRQTVLAEGSEDRIVLLARRDGQYRAVGGAVFDGQRLRAWVSRLGDYGPAVHLDHSAIGEEEDIEIRCSFVSGSVSMKRAINSARNQLAVQGVYYPNPQLLAVKSEAMNPCGYSTTWETRWYSAASDVSQRTADVEYTVAGSSAPIFSQELPCALSDLRALSPTTDSTGLANDFYERLTEAPEELQLHTLSCDDESDVMPQEFRLHETTTGEWARYSSDGDLLGSSF